MKKFLKVTMITILCFMLIGCGCSKKDNNKDKNKEVDENIVEKLYTNDTQLVYKTDAYKLVFYFNQSQEITGYEHYYEYANTTEAESKYKSDLENYKNDLTIKKIERKGKFVIYTMASSEYEGKTVSDIQDTYSFLIPVYKD